MLLNPIIFVIFVTVTNAVQFMSNLNSEMSADDKTLKDINKALDQSEQELNSHEVEDQSNEDHKIKKFLSDAMETVLDPTSPIEIESNIIQNLTSRLTMIESDDLPLEQFMQEMDKLSAEACGKTQQALWSYLTDIKNPIKKINMIQVMSQEDEIKSQYWIILKRKYNDDLISNNILSKEFQLIKERAINVKMQIHKPEDNTDEMQLIWRRATVCKYNTTHCRNETRKTMKDITAIFKTSADTNELLYYWKAFRDQTGKKLRPLFNDYILIMNNIAKSEEFNDAGETWRFMYKDDNFTTTVETLWSEIKPLYNELHTYVRTKLKVYYGNKLNMSDETIPAHILGNLWAQDWQSIYHLLPPYPDHGQPEILTENVTAKTLFNSVNDFYMSLGFESSKNSYDYLDSGNKEGCLPSSHDMCDGINYKIKWCSEDVKDVRTDLLRIGRLLGHIQYFKSYQDIPVFYRDGPTPAFQEALSDIISIQMITPEYLKSLKYVKTETGNEVLVNHLMWLALERFPLMAHGYVLDKWRWDVFSNVSGNNLNEYWWKLRQKETGISPPVPRNESDLDPASKFHILSRVQYITFLISNVLEFQVIRAMCKVANHTGPLHLCNLYGNKKAGHDLRGGMSMGVVHFWRYTLRVLTGETKLSTAGILEYFEPLHKFLKAENAKLIAQDDIDASAPFVFGFIGILLTLAVVVAYCSKRRDFNVKILSMCGLCRNGSLDIVSNEMSTAPKTIEVIVEDKV